jgi:hypothetical protein
MVNTIYSNGAFEELTQYAKDLRLLNSQNNIIKHYLLRGFI